MLEKTALRLLSLAGLDATPFRYEGRETVPGVFECRGPVGNRRFELRFEGGKLVSCGWNDEYAFNTRTASGLLRKFVSIETTKLLRRGDFLVVCRFCGKRERPTLRVRRDGAELPFLELWGDDLFGGLLAGVVYGEVPIEVLADKLEEERMLG